MKTKTIDLWDALEDIQADLQAEIDEVQDDKDALLDPVGEKYGNWSNFADEDQSGADSVSTAYAELHDEEQEYRQQVDALEQKVEEIEEEWGDTEFTVSELTVEQAGRVQDLTGQKITDGVGDVFEAAEGKAMTELLRMCVNEGPPGSPNDAGSYPAMLGPLLQKPVAELSGMVQEDLGKSSPQEWMES